MGSAEHGDHQRVHVARDHGGPQRLLGAPIRGSGRRARGVRRLQSMPTLDAATTRTAPAHVHTEATDDAWATGISS